MDATDSTTQYDFQLITIFSIDKHGAGLPVAWAISNREDITLLTEFLKAVHARVGNLQPTYFMSDCAEQYFNSWCGVYWANNTQKLLCICHIDSAWRKSLNEHVSAQQERIEIYRQLRVLLQERDESEYMIGLQRTMSYLNDRYEDFYKYFKMYYVPYIKESATYYRIGTIVNTNMFMESFHRVLKVVYFNNKQNRRVDHLIRTYTDPYVTKINLWKGKKGRKKKKDRNCEITKRHKAAQELQKNSNCTLQSCGLLTCKRTFYVLQQLKQECDC